MSKPDLAVPLMVQRQMRPNRRIWGLFLTGLMAGIIVMPAHASTAEWTTDRICQEIDRVSQKFKMPRASFTRLIWTESRFDTRAVSPKGAQGIAQFMPATAKARGLKNPFDPEQALEASAFLLDDLRGAYGNFGLAIMAYNAGPGRVDRWLKGKSTLPFETQDYVAAITGKVADVFRKQGAKLLDFSLQKGKGFMEACRAWIAINGDLAIAGQGFCE